MRTWLPGDTVRIRDRTWRILHTRRDHTIVRFDVENRSGRRTFLAPFDRPAPIDRVRWSRVRRQQARARLAGMVGRTSSVRSLASAADAALTILAYQLEPALAMVHGRRRVLIADEVGLGKTIQAGLIAAETLHRDPSARVLLVVPATLRAQWIGELSDRFHLTCHTADRDSLDSYARRIGFDESPWRRAGIWIASLDFLKQPHVLDALPLEPWDLAVIDEAHGACGDSERYRAAAAIGRRSRRLVALTATPHSGDDQRFARLTRLGELPGIDDELAVFRRTRADVGLAAHRKVRWLGVHLSNAERRVLHVLGEYERAVTHAAGERRRDAALLLLSVFRKRALSTMAALTLSIERRLAVLDAAAPESEEWRQPHLWPAGDDADADDAGDWRALGCDVGIDEHRERPWLRRLLGLAREASRHESKLAAVARMLARTREPVVLFTEFRHSLQAAAKRLERVRSIAIVHGGLAVAESARELERFRAGDASVLLATDVAGQGLNLQNRARWVISLELPWNPARLEQRAGRVDRIGQSRPVRQTMLIARHEMEGGLLSHLARRAMSARRALGADVLPVAPDERSVADALFAADRARPPSLELAGPAIAVSRQWTRAAAAEARRLVRARALIGRWRAPAGASGTGRWKARAVLPALQATGGTLIVYRVPLIDRLGAVVEQHIVTLRVRESWVRIRQDSGRLGALSRRAALSAVARARRAGRLLARVTARNIAVERAIGAALLETSARGGQPQPGLFDRRFDRELARASSAAGAIDAQLRLHIARHDARTVIEVGRPVLVMAIDSRS